MQSSRTKPNDGLLYNVLRALRIAPAPAAQLNKMLSGIKDAVIIYNPVSGTRLAKRLAQLHSATRILAAAGIAAEIVPSQARGSATGIARQALARRAGLIIACGGDGTVNEVLNGMAGSQVPLGVLPAGTANILAKELNIPWDIKAAARLIPESTPQRVALGAISSAGAEPSGNTRYFLCVAGAGPDGQLVHALEHNPANRSSMLDYWRQGFRQLFSYPFPEFRVKSYGREEMRATLLVVGRTQNYGGPFRITTGASLFEDSFEFVAYTARNRFRLLMCLPAIWLGCLRQMPGIESWKAPEVTCVPGAKLQIFVHVDGEPAGTLPLHFRIVPDALSLLVPPGRGKTNRQSGERNTWTR